jgi:hypothetical protein
MRHCGSPYFSQNLRESQGKISQALEDFFD